MHEGVLYHGADVSKKLGFFNDVIKNYLTSTLCNYSSTTRMFLTETSVVECDFSSGCDGSKKKFCHVLLTNRRRLEISGDIVNIPLHKGGCVVADLKIKLWK